MPLALIRIKRHSSSVHSTAHDDDSAARVCDAGAAAWGDGDRRRTDGALLLFLTLLLESSVAPTLPVVGVLFALALVFMFVTDCPVSLHEVVSWDDDDDAGTLTVVSSLA